MKIEVSKSALMVLGLILGAGNVSAATKDNADPACKQAAAAIQELIAAGVIQVDAKTGNVLLQKSVLEILKDAGMADENTSSETDAAGSCSATGACCT